MFNSENAETRSGVTSSGLTSIVTSLGEHTKFFAMASKIFSRLKQDSCDGVPPPI